MQAILQTFFDPIFPVFGILLIGYVFAKRALFDLPSAQAINRFVFYVALPALLFSLLSSAEFEWMNGRLLALYFLSELALYAIGTLVTRYVFRREWGEAILLGMASCFANHAFFVLPIARLVYGDQATLIITAIISIDTTVIFAGTIVGLEIAAHQGDKAGQVIRRFMTNPVLAAIGAGVLVQVLKINVPDGVHTYTHIAGRAAAPAALFSLGIILAGSGIAKGDGAALSVTGLKVLLHPLVAWIFFCLSSGDPMGYQPALLVAAGPCGAMPFVLALQYQRPAETICRAIIYSTVASLATLSAIAA